MTQQFYKLTPEELVRLRTEIARPTHREIFLYLMALCPFRDKSIDIDTQAIAEALGIHPKTVSKALRALADRGWIEMTITKATCSISRSEPNGSTSEPNGSTPEPNGSTPEPNGSTPEPNGSTPEPNGSTPEPNGSTYTPQSPSEQGFQKPLDLEEGKDLEEGEEGEKAPSTPPLNETGKETSPSPKNNRQVNYERFVAAYNAYKPDTWEEEFCGTLKPSDKGAITKLINSLGSDEAAIATLQVALEYVKQFADPFWRDTPRSFGVLFAADHITDWATRGRAKGIDPSSPPSNGTTAEQREEAIWGDEIDALLATGMAFIDAKQAWLGDSSGDERKRRDKFFQAFLANKRSKAKESVC
jgi:hypothetical protein